MPTFNYVSRILAYEDPSSTNNPEQRPFDWSRKLQGIVVENPSTNPYKIAPLQSVTLFTGVKTLTADGTTQYDLSLSALASNRYRLTWDGTGTAPGFRTARTVDFADGTVIVAPQSNTSVIITASAGSVFGNVQEGDTVFVPGVSTGDSVGPFDSLNEGFWFVLTATSSQLVLSRFPNTVYSAKAETVTVAENTSFQVFSSTGVQLDDVLQLGASFPVALRQSYEIVAVTASFVEFISGTVLAPVTNVVPGASAVTVYDNAKVFLCIETDQNVDVAINGNTAFTVEPILAGDPTKVGTFNLTGIVYSLSVTNKSTQTATVRIFSVE